MEMKQQILEKLQKIVKELTNEEVTIELTRPADASHGDYTTNIALRLAKTLGKNPLDIAEEIAQKFDKGEGIANVEAVRPGFINFSLSIPFLVSNIESLLHAPEKVGRTTKFGNKKVIIEFTDPNPFKEFHIGHVYTNIVGESLSRLFEANGAEVQRADYFGDVGMHVAKALWGLQKKLAEDNMSFDDLAQKNLDERIAYFGQAYAKGSTAYEEKPETQDEMKKLNKLIYIAAQKMWEKEKGLVPQVYYQKGEEVDEKELERIYHWYSIGRGWSLEYFETIYQRLNMKFAGYYPESIAGEKGYQLVKDHIADGVFEEHEGAVVFRGEKHNLHTRVFINSLGLPTYEAKELGLAVWKSEEFPYDFSIILTGNEINEYFKVLMKALSLIKPELAAKSKHIGHGMVKLASGKKMSSRTGQIIAGKEVLDEAKRLAKERIAEAAKSRWDVLESKESIGLKGFGNWENVQDYSEEKDQIAEQVGVGAVKYSFLKSGIGKDIPFSFEESVSFEGNAGPYVQYTYVRTQSILAKVEPTDLLLSPDYTPQEEEMTLMRHLMVFSEIVEEAAETYSPNVVTEYLYELAKEFNTFYQKHRIVNAPTQLEKDFRLALTEAVGVVLKQGLGLLGIAAPDRM